MSDEKVHAARTLESLEPDRPARIVSLGGGEPRRLVRLADLGLVPGARIRLLHRRPATVISCDGTTVALDREISAGIRVTLVD
jgi:Fe2+ transport system protein FeoA